MVAISTVFMRVALPFTALGAAGVATEKNWGLLNWLELSPWLSLPIAFVVLDFFIYVQHRAFHAVPILWRLHRMHHSDLDFDTTTGVRFHPLEYALSMCIKGAGIIAIGAPALAVLLFEIALNATSLFNHGNLALGERLDHRLRRILVTPDMHRVHHSTIPAETNSNFGFNLPWWDFLLKTYTPAPKLGHQGMEIGLSEYRARERLTLGWLLIQPFTRSPWNGR